MLWHTIGHWPQSDPRSTCWAQFHRFYYFMVWSSGIKALFRRQHNVTPRWSATVSTRIGRLNTTYLPAVALKAQNRALLLDILLCPAVSSGTLGSAIDLCIARLRDSGTTVRKRYHRHR